MREMLSMKSMDGKRTSRRKLAEKDVNAGVSLGG